MAPENDRRDFENGGEVQQIDDQHRSQEDVEGFLNRVAAALPAGFELDRGRIWKDHRGNLSPVCAPIVKVARARHTDGTGWCHLVHFLAADGSVRETVISARQLISSPAIVIGQLADQGFELWAAVRDVCGLLQQMEPPDILEAVSVTGWIGGGLDAYVLPDGRVLTGTGDAVENRATRVLFTGPPRQMPACRGTVDEWSNMIAGTAVPSPPVAVGVCIAIASLFLSHTGASSFMLHLSGDDKANTACRAVAASAWGAPGALEITWEKPAREIAAAVGQARDGLLIISGYEAHHAKKVGTVTTALTARDGLASEGSRVVILSTGAVPLMEAGGPHGQSNLRSVIDLNTQSWSDCEVDDATADAIRIYGSFGPASVKALIKYGAREGRLRTFLNCRCDDILNAMRRHPAPADADTRRVSQALGALFGAGNFMINRKALHWEAADLESIFRQLAEQWVAQHSGLLPEGERILLAALAEAVADLEPELVSLNAEDISDTADGVGWHDAQWLYLATPAMTRLALAVERAPDRIVALLKEQGLLQPGMERGLKFRMTSRIAGRPRTFRVSRDLLRFAHP